MRYRFSIVATITITMMLTALTPPLTARADSVTVMDDPLYQLVQPVSNASLVTPWADEAAVAARDLGYSVDLGTPFRASTTPEAGLSAVHRLWNPATVDFTNAIVGSSAYQAALSRGYADQGVRFYALASAVSGRTEPVDSYVKAGKHRLATTAAGTTLAGQGWTREGVAFHMPAPTAPVTAPPPSTPPATAAAGSLPVGSARYPVPAGAVFASPSGQDSAAGTQTAPVRSIARAVALAPAGGTVVVRAGTYRETVTWTKSLTIQNYPGEVVWLDGSTPVTGWVKDGTAWRKDGWTTRFDHSPTYTQGAPDSTVKDWQFVNPATYPMAAHPDQVFVNGKPLQQVKSRSLVVPGAFYLDEATSRLYIGTDPTGRTVEASTRIRALEVRGERSTVRGIGVRRYSPSVFHMASVVLEKPRARLENVVVEDAATTGVSVLASDAVLERVTVRGAGMLGIHGRFADRVTLSSVSSTGNNDEHFNIAPVSGGVKLGHTRGVTVVGSDFSRNFGHGFWEDLSVYDTVVRQSTFLDNSATGLFLEISAKALVADSKFARNREDGIRVNNTSDVQIWNNTMVGNGRPLNLVQDARRNTNPTDQAVDQRQPFPDPTMPWTLGPVVVRNNVLGDSTTAANCLMCVEDYSFSKTAEQMGVTANGDVYHRSSASSPTWLAVWSRGSVNRNPYVFTTLTQFRQTTGQEPTGREYVGADIVDANLVLSASVASLAPSVAQPLPADVAARIGRPAGARVLGAW